MHIHYKNNNKTTTFSRILNDTFGECARPKAGWQIDPFGHSREMAAIFARMGFDGLFFARVDWRDKTNRLDTKNAEIIWKASANTGTQNPNPKSHRLEFYVDLIFRRKFVYVTAV